MGTPPPAASACSSRHRRAGAAGAAPALPLPSAPLVCAAVWRCLSLPVAAAAFAMLLPQALALAAAEAQLSGCCAPAVGMQPHRRTHAALPPPAPSAQGEEQVLASPSLSDALPCATLPRVAAVVEHSVPPHSPAAPHCSSTAWNSKIAAAATGASRSAASLGPASGPEPGHAAAPLGLPGDGGARHASAPAASSAARSGSPAAAPHLARPSMARARATLSAHTNRPPPPPASVVSARAGATAVRSPRWRVDRGACLSALASSQGAWADAQALRLVGPASAAAAARSAAS